MSEPFSCVENPTDEDRAAIVAPLSAYNEQAAGKSHSKPLALAVKDEQGKIIGGLWGKTSFDWLFVEFLVVPEALRGQDLGTKLIRHAEAIAIERKCVGAWLDTFAFQARGFYEKLGYTVFGEIEDHPIGSRRYFLQRRFPTTPTD
jgi:ribosomal protein S18 acetylase RimI-like enzyme